MLTATAYAAASIQVPAAICMPAPKNAVDIGQLVEKYLTSRVMELSDNRPERMIRIPIATTAHWLSTPSTCHVDEMVDWDFAIEVAPRRPTGTVSVTLEYTGRGTPKAIEDRWD
jgi:hypothetical protein